METVPLEVDLSVKLSVKELSGMNQGTAAGILCFVAKSETELRPICRGEMEYVWRHLIKRVRSKEKVEQMRKLMVFHGKHLDDPEFQRKQREHQQLMKERDETKHRVEEVKKKLATT
eukprot:770997_1